MIWLNNIIQFVMSLHLYVLTVLLFFVLFIIIKDFQIVLNFFNSQDSLKNQHHILKTYQYEIIYYPLHKNSICTEESLFGEVYLTGLIQMLEQMIFTWS